MVLTPPFAVSEGGGVVGPIVKSKPDWGSSAFLDRGKQHTCSPIASELGCTGFQGWHESTGCAGRPLVRKVEQPGSSYMAEPVIQGAHNSYYTRRVLEGGNPSGFRTSLKMVPPAVHLDRPTGKKFIPEPHGAPPRIQAPKAQFQQPSGHLSEPGMPRLSRPSGATILRESDQELSYEMAMGRKIRVGQDTYRGSGRAGDASQTFGPPRRPEDDALFFKSLKDSPTFTRFVNSLPPKPAVGPHERRAQELARMHQAEVVAERQLVASLVLPTADDDA